MHRPACALWRPPPSPRRRPVPPPPLEPASAAHARRAARERAAPARARRVYASRSSCLRACRAPVHAARGSQRVVVLDSDMLAIRPLDGLFERTRRHPADQLLMGHHAYDKAQRACGLPVGGRGNGGMLLLRASTNPLHVARARAPVACRRLPWRLCARAALSIWARRRTGREDERVARHACRARATRRESDVATTQSWHAPIRLLSRARRQGPICCSSRQRFCT